MPPTNIHVLIGRNGVGKTQLLTRMCRSLLDERADAAEVGAFAVKSDENRNNDGGLFANLVFVSFSAFDSFEPPPDRSDKSEGMPCAYIGLKRAAATLAGKALAPKSPQDLSAEFDDSVRVCRNGARLERWRRALETLAADPIFRSADVTSLANEGPADDGDGELKAKAHALFDGLSSGHKIVLLTITQTR